MMESPFLHPAFIATVAVGLIGFIAWLIRLEGKVNTNAHAIGRTEVRVEDSIKSLDQHRQNSDIHFNLRTAQEVEKRQDERWLGVKSELSEIKAMLKEIKGEPH